MIGYEWIVEEVEETGVENEVDVIDVNHWDTYRQAVQRADMLRAEGKQVQIGLTRDSGDETDGLQDRQWAYLEDGRLPPQFDGGARVPQRFHAEVANAE